MKRTNFVESREHDVVTDVLAIEFDLNRRAIVLQVAHQTQAGLLGVVLA
jgi:hypothetical protein